MGHMPAAAGQSAYRGRLAGARRDSGGRDACDWRRNLLHLQVEVRHGVVREGGVEKIRLPAHRPEERKPHAWSVAGTVREEQPPEGRMGRIVGVKVRCEHCGAEAVVDMPGGICQA